MRFLDREQWERSLYGEQWTRSLNREHWASGQGAVDGVPGQGEVHRIPGSRAERLSTAALPLRHNPGEAGGGQGMSLTLNLGSISG